MSISHYYNPQFNARAARAADSDAKTDKDQMVDSNAIDSLDHSLDQMSFEQCDGGIEGHLCGSFQHHYDQFQPDPHTARFSGREEIPRLVMRSENPSGGRTYNPMIFPPDNYCTPARLPPPPHASEESWIYDSSGVSQHYCPYQGRLLPDHSNIFNSDDEIWMFPELAIPFSTDEFTRARTIDETTTCGTPDSSFSFTFENFREQNQSASANANANVAASVCTGASSPPTPTVSRPYKCRVRSCGLMFKRRAELERHRDSVHQPSSGHPCPVLGCNRNNREHGFSRKDNLRQHLKLKHDVKFPKGRGARG